MVHIGLRCRARFVSGRKSSTRTLIQKVLVSCYDGSSYAEVTDVRDDGSFLVDFVLDGDVLTDTLKFFFYANENRFLTAGYIDLWQTMGALSDGNHVLETFHNIRTDTLLSLEMEDLDKDGL